MESKNIKMVDINLVNKKFPFVNLKGKDMINNRELITVDDFGLAGVRHLNLKCDCIQKIFYSKGRNAYRLFAPKGFSDFIKLQVAMFDLIDYLEEKNIRINKGGNHD